MSSNPNHPYSDYLRDIYMEIHSTFYPPPAVTIPKVNIPIPSLNSYLYSFQREKEAILEYEKEREKPKMKPPDLTSAKSLESTRNESTFAEKLPRPSMVPQEILQPSRISFPTTSKMEVLQPSTSISGGARALNGYEEFERVTNVFDLMEIRSLDDKAELEMLLKPIASSSSQPDIPNGNVINNISSAKETPFISIQNPIGPPHPMGSTSSVPSSLPSYGSK